MARSLWLTLALLATVSNTAAGQSFQQQAVARATAKRTSSSNSPHIDGALRQMINDFRAPRAAGRLQTDAVPRVPVTIRFRSAETGSAHRNMLAAVGAAPANEHRNIIESYVPIDAIETLAANPEVVAVEWIVPPAPQVIGQGVAAHNASSWQASAHSGAGVKVGIIDVGFVGLISLIGSELPAGVIGRCYSGVGSFSSSLAACETGTVHGTAVAEAVADIAPGVQLYVANPFSALDLRNTEAWMTSQGVRVINHSAGWIWSGPGDGTTPFADSPLSAVDDAVANGAVWTNAAGNAAQSTWSGSYSDANGNNWLEFSGAAELNGVNLRAGQQFVAQARWEDSWTAATRDLDLYLLDSFGQIVAGSEGSQDGAPGSIPREVFAYTAPSTGTYFLAVYRYAGATPAWVDVQAFSGEQLQFRTPAHSIANPAETANPGALAVGAVSWSDTYSIESFSSVGPTRDGRMKPDLAGADRTDSVSYGPGGFAGTSQAAPHVAGLAALVIEAFPAAGPRLIADYLRAVAAPRGLPGNTFGVGFAQVPAFPATISLSALVTSPAFPESVGQPVSWTAFAIGAQAPFEYKFWIFSPTSGWTVLKDYSPDNVATWTPLVSGTYAMQVWARRIGSSAAFEDWRGSGSFVINPAPPLSVASLVANVSFPASINTPITWTAVASGGVGPVQYQFWRFREGTGWSIVRDYSSVNTFTWTPTATDIGKYALQVWVRSSGSTVSYEAWIGTNYFNVISPPVTVTNLSATASYPITVGTSVIWTAVASGGTAPLQYQFWRFKQGTGWTMVQDYSSLNAFSWTPQAVDAGTYALQVWVRQTGSAAAYDAWRGTDYFVVNPHPAAAVTSFTQTPSPPTTVGTPITWSVTAAGGTQPLQYKFWLYSSGAWTVLQEYSMLSNVTWTPASPGMYAVQVWVRSSGSTATYDDWRSSGLFTIGVSPSVYVSDLTANVTFPASVTHAITWTATAGGGSASLSYQFWRYREPSGWSMVQDYSASSSYTWTPALGEEGTYAIQVWVRGAGSTAVYDHWRSSGLFKILPPTVLVLTSVAGDWVGAGTTQLVTPTDGNFTIARNNHNGISVTDMPPTSTRFWFLNFAAAFDGELTPGIYSLATRYPFQAVTTAGLDVSGEARGCNEIVGRFVVLDVAYALDGTPTTFAADFEQHCEGFAPALFGSIRFNSTVGVVPVQSLTFSEASPISVGVPVTWSAGITSGRESRAWLYRQSTRTWILLHDYAAEPTVVWTPQPGDQGNWALVMWERPVGSTAAYDTWRISAAITVQ